MYLLIIKNLFAKMSSVLLSPTGLFGSSNIELVQETIVEASDKWLDSNSGDFASRLSDFLYTIRPEIESRGKENAEQTQIETELNMGGPKSKLVLSLNFSINGQSTLVDSPVSMLHCTTLVNNPFGGQWLQLIIKFYINEIPQVLVIMKAQDHLRLDLLTPSESGPLLVGQQVLISDEDDTFKKGIEMEITKLTFKTT